MDVCPLIKTMIVSGGHWSTTHDLFFWSDYFDSLKMDLTPSLMELGKNDFPSFLGALEYGLLFPRTPRIREGRGMGVANAP